MSLTPSSIAVREKQAYSMFAEVANLKEEAIGMVFAIVSFPSGAEPDFQHLSDLKEAAKVDYYETRGREVVL